LAQVSTLAQACFYLRPPKFPPEASRLPFVMAGVPLAICCAALISQICTVAAVQKVHETGHGQDRASVFGHVNGVMASISNHTGRQTPEELGFTSDGDVDPAQQQVSMMSEEHCLDLGAKGFPLPVFKMLHAVDWSAQKYLEQIQSVGYVEDALQMTAPEDAILKSDCMKDGKGRMKHIFVGDSQMLSLRNALHRLNKCPEIWWDANATDARPGRKAAAASVGRRHSGTRQAPESAVDGCGEEGIASYIYWDAWVRRDVPVEDIRREIEVLDLEPKRGDTVVVWVGSNFISAARRTGVLFDTIDKMHEMGVHLVWDSPTFHDIALMAAASPRDEGRDRTNSLPISYSTMSRRKTQGTLGSNQFKSEKALLKSGVEIPMTKRWQLTNRYRGLQCDGMHTDMRARDPLFYNEACPRGKQLYGVSGSGCNWVEPFRAGLEDLCPLATGVDDLVLQSGLYAVCAAHERPFCYQHTETIR